MELSNFLAVLQIAGAAVMVVSAVYMAKFEGRMLEKMDKRYVLRMENNLQELYATSEHTRLSRELEDLRREVRARP